jgi:hypothetical protein
MDKKNIAKTAGIALAASLVAGLAIATPSLAAPSQPGQTFSAEQVGKKGPGKGGKHQDKAKANDVHVSQDITVEVPDDGATYKLVISQTATPASTNSTTTNSFGKGLDKNKTIVVAVTGTGSVTVTVPGLHPGTYTADLVKVSSSQTVTVTAPAAASTTN